MFEPIYPGVQVFHQVEVELSTACVSKCFACPRNANSDADLDWNVGALPYDTLFKFLSEGPPFSQLVFCGAYGDPIYHPQLPEILEELGKSYPTARIHIETNGSHRDPAWWTKLAKAATLKHNFCFSLDGLEDTNPIYRRGTNWDSIMEGVKTLRENYRGEMTWKMILFRHNEHQVIEAFDFSRELGFNSFRVIESVRHDVDTVPRMGLREVEDLLSQHKGSSKVL